MYWNKIKFQPKFGIFALNIDKWQERLATRENMTQKSTKIKISINVYQTMQLHDMTDLP